MRKGLPVSHHENKLAGRIHFTGTLKRKQKNRPSHAPSDPPMCWDSLKAPGIFLVSTAYTVQTRISMMGYPKAIM